MCLGLFGITFSFHKQQIVFSHSHLSIGILPLLGLLRQFQFQCYIRCYCPQFPDLIYGELRSMQIHFSLVLSVFSFLISNCCCLGFDKFFSFMLNPISALCFVFLLFRNRILIRCNKFDYE